jgi:hypothetical protein
MFAIGKQAFQIIYSKIEDKSLLNNILGIYYFSKQVLRLEIKF